MSELGGTPQLLSFLAVAVDEKKELVRDIASCCYTMDPAFVRDEGSAPWL